ncbi:MAG: helix-turn-helix domain-containing protein, partial [Leptospirales bacterium]
MTDTKKNSRVVGGSPAESFFARSLRYWRKQRGLSQMDLALEAGVSTRHLSFLETDRSRPGRVVVERLLAGLELEELDRRALLAAAGFPPEPASSPPNDRGDSGRADEKTRILFQRMLDQQEPYPGLVLDALGNIQNFNSGARRLFRLLDR